MTTKRLGLKSKQLIRMMVELIIQNPKSALGVFTGTPSCCITGIIPLIDYILREDYSNHLKEIRSIIQSDIQGEYQKIAYAALNNYERSSRL